MFMDNEADIIKFIKYQLKFSNVLLYNDNSYSRDILEWLKNIDKFTLNNGHDALPPDFYSDEFSCMFDVMRINDSEIKKSYNPVKIRERKAEQEIKKSGLLDVIRPDATINIHSEGDNDEEHTLRKYIKNCNRVMNEHIKKISIWKSQHPNIKNKGLLIFDETDCYFEGYVKHLYGNQYRFTWDASNLFVFHRPWMDASFVKNAYNSDLDFLIWSLPYKYGTVLQNIQYDYPNLVILDTRYSRSDYIEYDISKLERM